MQRRLLAFFAAVRARDSRLEWHFLGITTTGESWTEHDFATRGLPPVWLAWLNATAHFPFRTPHTNGCFTAHRPVCPRAAARQPQLAANRLVADVLAEFTPRLKPSFA